MKKITKLFLASLLMLLSGVIGTTAYAQTVTNGGFETGSLTPWAVSSAVTVSTGFTELAWTITPSGTGMARIEVSPALYKAAAETNLGLSAGALVALNSSIFTPATNFGTMTQSITLAAGQTVIAYWNYVSRDYDPYNDGVIATLVGPSYQNIKILSVSVNAYGSGAIVTGSYGSTGWFPVTFTAGAAGTYKLGFASFNSGDEAVDPILCIDNAAGGTSAPGMPIVLTSAITSTSCTTATCGGNVTSDGGSAITAKGVCWNTTGLPTVASSFTNEGAGSGTFTSTLTGLAAATTYYVRSYATNAVGISYGPEVTIVSTPSISGALTVCQSSTTTLTAVGSGSWTSTNTSVATVGTSGVVTGINAGTAVISYGSSTCAASVIVTVNPLPNAGSILGSSSVCSGSTIMLSNSASGGTWSSTSPSVASVSTIGVVTGGTAGSAVISYTASNSCGTVAATRNIVVNPLPSTGSISGPSSVCIGSDITLTNTVGGGTWSSTSPSVASISASGVVTGVTAGSAVISYAVSNSCGTLAATRNIVVNSFPTVPSISGNTTLSTAITTALTNTMGGGSWSSSTPAVATVNSSGIVTGVAAGTSIISYTVSVSGCATTVTTMVTVNTPNTALNFDGANDFVNIGSVLTANQSYTKEAWIYANASTSCNIISGGNHPFWLSYGVLRTQQGASISDPATFPLGQWVHVAATYDASTSTLKLYKNGNLVASSTSAATYPTETIYIGEYPIVPGNAFNGNIDEVRIWNVARSESEIKTDMNCNIAQSTNLIAYYRFDNGIANGTNTSQTKAFDYSGNNNCGTLNNFNLTGTSSNFVSGAVGNCNTISTSVASTTGSDNVCVGSTITLSNATTGGIWQSSNPSIATINSSGVVTGISNGTVTLSYSFLCNTVTKVVTVNPLPNAGSISGPSSVCPGSTITLTSSASGGSWSSTSPTVASVSASGVVTGGTVGSSVISYVHTNSCGTDVTTYNVVVNPLPDAGSISGASSVCVASTISLSNAATGGSWMSSSSSTASVSASGVVTGVNAGSAVISYVVNNSCGTDVATHNVVVNPLPNAGEISGDLAVCVDATTLLSSSSTEGTWSISNSNASISPLAGSVLGVTVGTAVVSYTATTVCGTEVATAVVTINPLPFVSDISGATSVCAGSTTTFSNTVTGGSWTSNNTSVATVSSTGVVTGVAAGSAVISYTFTNSCGTVSAVKNIVVNPLPEAGEITGDLTVCVDATTLLFSTATEGTWSISNANASISPLAGSVLGVTAGTAVVTYTATTVCGTEFTTATVTINPLPVAGTISGPATVCTGTTLALFATAAGGTWNSSSDNATVSSTGVVTGVSAGSVTISYSVTTSCGTAVATKDLTVLSIAGAGTITGTASLCAGGTTTLSNSTTGGTWSSGYPAVATVDASGVVTAVSAGNATISYRMTNFCGTTFATQVVTVNPLPNAGAIGGPSAVCEGSTITVPFISAAGSWSSSNPSAATIDNGTRVVTGIAAGTTTISFSVTNSCGTATSTKDITVNPAPVAGSLSGASVVCVGSTVTITPSVTGGTWLSSNAALASVSTSGEVNGLSAGIVTISYRVTNTCGIASATRTITVNPAVSVGTVGGSSSVCAGSNITLTNSTLGGAWSSSNTAAATVGTTGIVTGVAEGNTTISYTVTNSCGTAVATRAITVNPLPVAGTISGTATLCTGTTTTLSTTATGGTWISGTPSVASIGTDGVVTGLAAGGTTITYRVINGCGTANATYPVTVIATPSAGTIGGVSTVCSGSSITLTNSTSGGTWSSSNTAAATIGTSGIVTGVAAGTTTISYVVTSSCGSATATRDITVIALPDAGTISGTSSICRTTTTTLTSTVTGGTWSSNYSAGASVNATTGVVTGVEAGSFIISYRITNGCGTATATFPISILNAPVLGAISGATTVCEAATTTLANTTSGGTWSSTNAAAATIDASTGVATGVAAGTTTISYTVSNICGSATVSRVLTVNPLPIAAVISGTASISVGTTTTLTATPSGGSWLSASGTIASINSGTGVTTGMGVGVATISYTRTNSCGSVVTTVAVTVAGATTPITGVRVVCQGATTTLGNATAGGTWSTADAAIATVGTTGIVTGVGAGTTTVTYSFSGGGNATATVTVNAAPAAYTGSGFVCTGSQLNLGSIIPGCTWTSSNTARATVVSTTGIVTGGSSLGTVNISYTNAATCRTITQLTVNAGVALITGVSSPCLGSSITLANATSGGTWSSSNTARATIGESTGVLTAVGGGTVTISYTISSGCVRTATVTVGTPPSITGNPGICFGQTSLLSSSGGTWSSSNASIASVAANGIVTGISLGNAVITYRSTANPLCFVTQAVTVNPLPSPIVAPSALCPGQTATLTSSPAGGTWTSNFPAKASVDASTGVVTAVIFNFSTISAVNITYTLPTGCGGIATVSVNPLPSPIGGNGNICVAGSATLTSSTTGGTWSSASPAIATAAAGGVITGVSAGLATISYTNALGCANTSIVTVNAMPGANTGSASLCLPTTATTTLSNPAGAGTWSSSNTTRATVNFSSGLVTGINTGTANITYTKAAGCINVTQVTVTICGARPAMSEDTDGGNSVFSVSPNPTTGAINLTTDVVGKVVIYTIDGKQLQQYEAKAGTTSISMPAGLASGVYMLRFNGADGSSKMVRLVYQQ